MLHAMAIHRENRRNFLQRCTQLCHKLL